jgi:glycosyltransferase involved in cell wall biosynthesis
MSILDTAHFALSGNGACVWPHEMVHRADPAPTARQAPDREVLNRHAWAIGEQRPGDSFTPSCSHVGLAMVDPYQGFAHWRILHSWIEQTAGQRGDAWRDCRMVLRLYDVSHIEFNGLNAHGIRDLPLAGIVGQLFFKLPKPGTWQLAEVGFVLRSGEFIPAARSLAIPFAADAAAAHAGQAALLVNDRLEQEAVGNVWDQGRILAERRRPRLRVPLRLAAFTFQPPLPAPDGPLAAFAAELAAHQAAQGHEVHVFAPASDAFREPCQVGAVSCHPLPVRPDGSPVERAAEFARAAGERLLEMPSFDLFHLHDWMAGLAPWAGTRPTVLSLSSVEATRRNGAEPSELSRAIEQAEREAAHAADRVLTPDWLRDRAVAELGLDGDRVHAFPMEARLPNEWERPLDVGQVKMSIGFGPFDRLLLFVGPLEHAAGVDILLEALPVLLGRCPQVRLAYAGAGPMHGELERSLHGRGLGHAVRLLGDLPGHRVTELLRASEALVLPSRHRVAFDDAVVDLARRAGRAVVTTHAGPAYLVRHEDNGIVTYDNAGSMVWALERLLHDADHADRLGNNGRRRESGIVSWGEVARLYLELCARTFPELSEMVA